MKLTTRTRYATRALLDLALQETKAPVLLKDIAARQQLSLMYLGQLIQPLIRAGIIRSIRGPCGGICLAKPPTEINIADIANIFEGSTCPVECVDHPELCPRSNTCVTRDIWTEVEKAIDGVLQAITLQDLIERQKGKTQTEVATYYI